MRSMLTLALLCLALGGPAVVCWFPEGAPLPEAPATLQATALPAETPTATATDTPPPDDRRAPTPTRGWPVTSPLPIITLPPPTVVLPPTPTP